MNKPTLIFHADWSSNALHRWSAKAVFESDGRYTALGPSLVGDLTPLLKNLRLEAGAFGSVFAGFDFPIGVPAHFAQRAEISKFRDFLALLGQGVWKNFYKVCDTQAQLSVHRPFYPNRSLEGPKQKHLLDAHDAETMLDLLRICERGGNGQVQACSLFWTLGAKAVGKAALKGWEHVLVPALKDNSVRLWPFDGRLGDLLQPGHTVIAETYPAECYSWFSDDPVRSKTDIESRKVFGSNLLDWARGSEVTVEPRLENTIKTGFPIGKDDAFDAVVGLFGLLQICLGERVLYEPDGKTIREIEGWILGRRSRHVEQALMQCSANTDPELSDWLQWASKSGEVPIFVRAIAEAAFLADSLNYALLRPVLLELKRRNPCAPCDSD